MDTTRTNSAHSFGPAKSVHHVGKQNRSTYTVDHTHHTDALSITVWERSDGAPWTMVMNADIEVVNAQTVKIHLGPLDAHREGNELMFVLIG